MYKLNLSFKNGKKNGVWHYYHNSGLEANLENWNEGLKNGEFKIIDEKGIVMAQEFYKNNMPIGTHFKNFPDGKTKYVCVFDKKHFSQQRCCFLIVSSDQKNQSNLKSQSIYFQSCHKILLHIKFSKSFQCNSKNVGNK